jgi:hypothetical protein
MQPNRQAETTPTHVHQSLMHHCLRFNGVGGRHEHFQLHVSFSYTCLSPDQKLYASVTEHRGLFNVILGLQRKGGFNVILDLPCKGGFNRCNYCPHETNGCTWNCAQGRLLNRGDVPFQGRHDCHWTTACTNATQRNILWKGAGATLHLFSPYATNVVCLCQSDIAQICWLFLPNRVSPRNNTRSHIWCLIFLSDMNPVPIFSK